VHGVDRVVQRGDQLHRPRRVEIAQDPHVHARRERAPAAGQDHHARGAIGGERVEGRAHGVDHPGVEEVERRTVQRAPDGDTGPLDVEPRVRH